MNNDLTLNCLRSSLSYNPETGIFVWIVAKKGLSVGSTAGCVHKHSGYILICIDLNHYKAHRLAWLYTNGVWPEFQIDHINGIRNDNRIINLREATNSQNQANRGFNSNNTSGVKGVSWHTGMKKWRTRINVNGKQEIIGYFTDINEAEKAYEEVAILYFGEFKRKNVNP